MISIGLLGGVASGKSLVGDLLGELGAFVVDADRIGHEVLEKEPTIKEELRTLWGDSILDAEGEVDRAKVGEQVFGYASSAIANRRRLEALLHPRIRQRVEELRAQIASQNDTPVLVLDAPLLLEAGWDSICSLLVFVDSPEDLRQQRAQERGWEPTELIRREQAQLPLDAKRRRANAVIENSGNLEDLREQVTKFWAAHVVPLLNPR